MASSRRTVTGLLLSATFVLAFSSTANALPAFARKYGLRCSACHEAWPMLNYFGQKFKDNGYQLMNDRDAPIWQNPSYWPITSRITPFWHRESTNKIAGRFSDRSAECGVDSRVNTILASIYADWTFDRRHAG